MAQFWVDAQGSRGEIHRLGNKSSGVHTTAAGWGGAIRTRVWYDELLDQDMFEVTQVPWQGSGVQNTIAYGVLGVAYEERKAES